MNGTQQIFPGPAPEQPSPPAALEASQPVRLGLSHWVLSFPVVLALALAVLVFYNARDRFKDPDTWWHLKVGESIWNTRSIPDRDQYSYTTGNRPWLAHEWLSQLSLYAAYRWGGYPTLWLWLAGFGSLLFILLYVLCSLHSGNAKVSLLGGMMGWYFGTVSLALRPLILGHVFLIVELILIHLARRHHRRWLWGLPPLFAVWVNCHGSHFFGLGVLGLYLVCSFLSFRAGLLASEPWDARTRKLLCAILPGSVAALFVNPMGWRLPFYPLDLIFRQKANLEFITEWNALDFQSAWGMGLLVVTLVCALLVLLRRTELRLDELLLFLAGVFVGARHTRLVFVFGILAAPLLCRLLADLWPRWEPGRDNRVANAVMILASLAILTAVSPGATHLRTQVEKNHPAGAVEFIRKTGLAGPMLHDYVFGGYLIWALPEHKVFADGRADLFVRSGVFMEYMRWSNLQEDPRVMLDKYKINFCLLQKNSAMNAVLPYIPGWKKVYSDEIAVIFARQ